MANTPLPWRVEPHDGYIPDWCEDAPVQILGADGEIVADNVTFYPTAVTPGDAEMIVRAVNAHDQLMEDFAALAFDYEEALAALRLAAWMIEQHEGTGDENDHIVDAVRSVLAKHGATA